VSKRHCCGQLDADRHAHAADISAGQYRRRDCHGSAD
jgi:hypothetical protein